MNKSEKFYAFLESLTDSSNQALINTVKQAFVITEKMAMNEASVRGMPIPDVKSPERRRLQTNTKQATPEEIEGNKARFKRDTAQAGQGRGRASGAMKQIEKYAMTAPIEVEEWINTVLKPAIKAGKKDTDAKYGTNSAKVGFGQRLKNMGKAMLGEGQEVDYDGDYNADFEDEDEDENEIGGFQSNKCQSREAKKGRTMLTEGQEVDFDDDDEYDPELDEDNLGGFKSNKEEKREAQMRRGSLKN